MRSRPPRLNTFFVRLLACFLAVITVATAALAPDPLTPKERAQGYRDHRILAKPRADFRDEIEAVERRSRVRLRRKFDRVDRLRVLELDAGDDVNEAIARLRATGRYDYVEPDRIRYARVLPNDPSFNQQWSLRNSTQIGADIGAVTAWNTLTDASDVVVAVADSGIRLTHSDLLANLWSDASGNHGINALMPSSLPSLYYKPNDDDGHGTHVAGIIGAVGNNNLGVAGIAWKTRLMALKFIDSTGTGSSSDSVECINYAIAHGAHLINGSYGSSTYSSAEYDALKAARDAGIIFVAAAGNAATDNDTIPDYPAAYALDNIVAVAATSRSDVLDPDYSNYGSGSVELAAPGTAIYSTYNTSDNGYQLATGTSMAAPHVTGALALLKAKYPSDTYRQLINRLLRSTTKLPTLRGKVQTGGRLNLALALTATSNLPFNDDFAARAELAGPNIRVRSSNVGATRETALGEPTHAGVGSASSSLWWSWTAPSSGQVGFDTNGSDYDTVLAIYTGASLNALTPFASNDNAEGVTTSRILTTVTQGTTYQIAIAGKNGAAGLTVLKIGTVPPNDDFANAETISGRAVRLTATNLNSSRQNGEAVTPNGAGHTLWYKWTAPDSGRYHVAAFSTEVDATAAVYVGSSVADVTGIAANDNSSATNSDSLVRFEATAGTTYFIQVDNTRRDGSEGGNITLTLADSVWEFPVDDEVTSSPAVASDGTVYFGSVEGYVYAVTQDGVQKWRYPAGSTPIGSIEGATPTIAPDDGTVYIASLDASFYALDARTGEKKWSFAASSPSFSAPALGTDGTVYFRDNLKLYALTSGGELKWNYTLNTVDKGGTYCSPVVAADGTIYVGTTDGTLFAFTDSGASATLKWTYTANGDIYTSPAIAADGTLYFGTLSGRFYALTPGARAATVKWSIALPAFNGTDASISSSPAIGIDGTVYFAAYDHKLYALDPVSGATKWTYTLGDEVRASSPAVAADGTVYIGAYDGVVYAVSPTGTLVRTFATALRIRSSAVLANHRLFIGSADAKLHAFNLGQGAATSPWPMLQQNARRTAHVPGPLAIVAQPAAANTTAMGGTVTLSVAATGSPVSSIQWQFNGNDLPQVNGPTLSIVNADPTKAGIYTAVLTNEFGATFTRPAIVGVTTTQKVSGSGRIVDADVKHPNGNIYDQLLLLNGSDTVTAASLTADPGKITRISFVDLDKDIVQVEFSGAGTLSLVIANPYPAAPPEYYTQPEISYVRGHATIVIAGADETTNVSVFSVGRMTAYDPTQRYNFLAPISASNDPANNGSRLFQGHADTPYDGIADIASIAILSANGKFGGVRTANAEYFAQRPLTGIYAPGVAFTGPVFVGNVNAFDSATPMLILGSATDVRVAGGDLLQANTRPVEVSGITRLQFTAGVDSHGRPLPARSNRASLQENGSDVTSRIVVNPTP